MPHPLSFRAASSFGRVADRQFRKSPGDASGRRSGRKAGEEGDAYWIRPGKKVLYQEIRCFGEPLPSVDIQYRVRPMSCAAGVVTYEDLITSQDLILIVFQY